LENTEKISSKPVSKGRVVQGRGEVSFARSERENHLVLSLKRRKKINVESVRDKGRSKGKKTEKFYPRRSKKRRERQ